MVKGHGMSLGRYYISMVLDKILYCMDHTVLTSGGSGNPEPRAQVVRDRG